MDTQALAECWAANRHLSDVVGIAVGVCILLPVAPTFLKRFLEDIDIDAERITKRHFREQKHVRQPDLERIAVCAKAIEDEKRRCNPLAWGWMVIDVVSAAIGILLLWSGLVEFAGKWVILLFLPPVGAVACSYSRYLRLRHGLTKAIEDVKRQVEARADGGFVAEFAAKGLRTLSSAADG